MKDATGELSMTAIAVVAIAAIAGIFTLFILPRLRSNLSNQVKCQSAFGCVDNGDGTATCSVYDDDGNVEQGVICPSASAQHQTNP